MSTVQYIDWVQKIYVLLANIKCLKQNNRTAVKIAYY
jgi:hypothetical protein